MQVVYSLAYLLTLLAAAVKTWQVVPHLLRSSACSQQVSSVPAVSN